MKTKMMFAAIALLAIATLNPANSMSASASADASCGGYAGPGLRSASTSYSGDASGAITDVGASFSAHGAGTLAVSESDAGAWPLKLTASVGDSGSAAVPDGTTVTAEGHASATGSLMGGNPPPADKVDSATCKPNTRTYSGSLGVLCNGVGQFSLVGTGAIFQHQGTFFYAHNGPSVTTYQLKGDQMSNDEADYVTVQGIPQGALYHSDATVNISPNVCKLTTAKVLVANAN